MEDKMRKSYEKINISEEAKKRIEMAIIMEEEEKSSRNRNVRKHTLKVAIAACLSVFLVVPTGVYAATKIYQYFQSTVTKNDRRVDMEMSKPVPTTMVAQKRTSSTPEKLIQITTNFGENYGADKTSDAFQGYSYKGGFEAGKSFCYELIYMDEDQKSILSTYNNEEYEQIKINGRKAVYCKSSNVVGSQYGSDHLTEYGQSMYIFVEDYGYMIRMGAQLNLEKEEFIKLAEALKISEANSKKDAAAYVLYSKSGKCGWEVQKDGDNSRVIDTEHYYTEGTAKVGSGTVKVTDVKVLDSVSSLDKKSFDQDQEYDKLFAPDGSIKSYEREKIKNGDGVNSPEEEVVKTETVQPKLVYVTAEFEDAESAGDDTYQVPSLHLLSKEDGQLYEYYNEYNRPSYVSYAFTDNMPCYFEESLGGQSFYHTKKKDGKTILHFAYLVDEDQLGTMALCLNGWMPAGEDSIYLDISQKIK